MTSIKDLPDDVTRSILFLLDDTDLIKACSLNENFSKKICNDNFWLNKIINRFGLSGEEVKRYSKGMTYLDYYKKLAADTKGKRRMDLLFAVTRPDLVTIGLKRGIDVHFLTDAPLRSASQTGKTETVKLLLDNGADIHALNDYSLGYAAYSGHTDTVKLLLEYGADVNANNNFALKHAIISHNIAYGINNMEIIKLLLEYGADVNAEVFEVAENLGHADVLLELRSKRSVHALRGMHRI